MSARKPYPELVAEAEKAVVGIKDAELRRVAFERVLDDLMSTARPSARVSKPQRSGSERSSAPAKKARGPKAYVRRLVDDGFFKKPKTISEVKAELANQGHHIVLTSLSGPLQQLCKDRVLRRHKSKAGPKDKKAAYNYSEW
jgi:hypothetical protein